MDNSTELAEWAFSFRGAGRQVRSALCGKAEDEVEQVIAEVEQVSLSSLSSL
jgi:hypothetical protein